MKNEVFKVQMIEIDKIIPYARNPRKNDQAIPEVLASINEYGFRQPIVIDKENVIVVGHSRWMAAKQLGYKLVPCHVAENLTPQQIKAYRIADNKTHEKAEWDYDLLTLELEEVEKLYTGFTDTDLHDLFDKEEEVEPPIKHFSPTLTPTQSFKEYDEDDVERSKTKVENAFNKESKKLYVVCPECAHEFTILGE